MKCFYCKRHIWFSSFRPFIWMTVSGWPIHHKCIDIGIANEHFAWTKSGRLTLGSIRR